MDHDAAPIFIQALCALGNSIECRDFVHSCRELMPQMNKQATLLILRTATWTLAKFFCHKPRPPFNQMKYALPLLKRLVHSNDIQVVANACWSLSYLCAGSVGNIQSVIETGVVPRLVEILQHPSLALVPALGTIGNIVTGDLQQTQCVISFGALPVLANLLNHNYEKIIKKEACWMISNITVGIKEQIQAVIDANLIPTLVNLAQNAEFDIKKEALWAISNAVSRGSHDQIKYVFLPIFRSRDHLSVSGWIGKYFESRRGREEEHRRDELLFTTD